MTSGKIKRLFDCRGFSSVIFPNGCAVKFEMCAAAMTWTTFIKKKKNQNIWKVDDVCPKCAVTYNMTYNNNNNNNVWRWKKKVWEPLV